MASTVPPQELALVVDISLSMTEHLKLVKVRDEAGEGWQVVVVSNIVYFQPYLGK